jgi:hypothetical protein
MFNLHIEILVMKQILTSLFLILAGIAARAQSDNGLLTHVKHTVQIKFIGQDSVNLPLNSDFELIEESCSQITRYGHYNQYQHFFYGPFKDVSVENPKLIITEGAYTLDGLKEGYFTMRYLNGNLQAKGSFKVNHFNGKWEVYYDNGKPKLVFEADSNHIKIIDAWDAKGVRTVDNGKGIYVADLGGVYWKGKLVNGRPDGTWRARLTDDATNTDRVVEQYKNGLFQHGKGFTGEYNDISKLELAPPELFPFIKVEDMHASAVPCGGIKSKHLVNAQYDNGMQTFTEEIARVITPYLEKVDLKSYQNTFTIDGDIDETGRIVNLAANNALNISIAQGLINQLKRLPKLSPATADGKPIKQRFSITFEFSDGVYKYGYKFLPLSNN